MTEESRFPFFIAIFPRPKRPDIWEWRLFHKGQLRASGFEKSAADAFKFCQAELDKLLTEAF